MKRIWFGAVLLVLLLILGIGTSSLMKKTWQTQSKNLERAAQLASDGDWVTAEALWEEAKQEWDRKQFLISALYRHEIIDEIDGFFAQLSVFSASRRTVSFSSTCAYLARQLDSLGQSHRFNPENLL